eukprot:scaffold88967_cov53-Attheya_sp.AAC.3
MRSLALMTYRRVSSKLVQLTCQPFWLWDGTLVRTTGGDVMGVRSSHAVSRVSENRAKPPEHAPAFRSHWETTYVTIQGY